LNWSEKPRIDLHGKFTENRIGAQSGVLSGANTMSNHFSAGPRREGLMAPPQCGPQVRGGVIITLLEMLAGLRKPRLPRLRIGFYAAYALAFNDAVLAKTAVFRFIVESLSTKGQP
jgi:hypothetical protein